jgi:Icc-related predicted phosphoesterase
MRITFISDTHTKHTQITQDLPGGDLLIHAGDLMNSGYYWEEVYPFLDWYNNLGNYDHKVFIAGNHDRLFEDEAEKINGLLTGYKNIDYLRDEWIIVGDADPHDSNVKTAKIYGSPWQPEFYNWAFNLPRNGEDLREKWFNIPNSTDILITHGPPWGHCDVTPYGNLNVGCELLRVRVDELKPKIHVFGHVHSGYGYKFHEGTHFINASVLSERYQYSNKPITVDWNPETNELEFI